VMDGMVRDAVLSGATSDQIRGLLFSTGFRSMQEDALEKVQRGQTTLEEVLRVVPMDKAATTIRCTDCGRECVPGFRFCPTCGYEVGRGAEPLKPREPQEHAVRR